MDAEEIEQEQGQSQELVAFIVSTLVQGDHLTHDSMFSHEPQGSVVCIHSVCVDPAYHRRGIARQMLSSYTKHLQDLKLSDKKETTIAAEEDEEDEKEMKEEEKGALSNKPRRNFTQLDRVLLITHKELIGLYSGAGYQLLGPSKVVHGPELWYEMVHFL